MNILALDSSDQVLSAALSSPNGIQYFETDNGIRHSELLMETVDTLFKRSGLLSNQLDCVACMKGPGSFTGLRIGFSAAKGLAMALGIPLFSIPTLDCLAYHLSMWPGIVIPAIDSKKDCFFTALYQNGELLSDYMDISPENLSPEIMKKQGNIPILVTGSGAVLLTRGLADFLSPSLIKIDPQYKKGRAKELLEIINNAKIDYHNDIDSGPLYLRKSDAELNRG